MDFKVGDKAVYPAHGVGEIREIVTRELDGEATTFYVMRMDKGITISVPVDNARTIGMRPVITADRVDEVYGILSYRDVPTDNQTWNRRYRDYQGKIGTGDPIEVAKVLRDLALLRADKPLSFGERKMFDQARDLLAQEIACARSVDEKTIRDEMEGLFMPPAQPASALKA
jgi:CarD family transcriptional regulator